MTRSAHTVCVVNLALALPVGWAAADSPNLCPNPRFRDGSGGTPAGWTLDATKGGSGAWLDKRGRHGGRCVQLKTRGARRAEWVSAPVAWPSPAADVSAWLRCHGIAPDDPAHSNAALDLRCYDARKRLGAALRIGSVCGTKAWQYVHRVAPVPAGTVTVRLAVRFNRLIHGEALLSDVVLQAATAEPCKQHDQTHPPVQRIVVTTGKPGNVFAPDEAWRFRIAAPPGIVHVPYRLLDDRGCCLEQGSIDVKQGQAQLELAPHAERVGRHLRLAVGVGEAGTVLVWAVLPKRPSAAGGDTRFGGWIVHKPIEALRLGLRLGMSVSYPNWRLDADKVDVCRRHGMKLNTNGIGANRLFQIWPYDDFYKNGFRRDARLAEWQAGLAAYLKTRRGVIADFSSLGGEYAHIDNDRKATGLRDIHATFYRTAKQADPGCRVFLGMLMSDAATALERILATADPKTFAFDGVSYDWTGVPEWGMEDTLEHNTERMRRFSGVKPQWICETWVISRDDRVNARQLARIYAMGLGLGCKEVDWHGFWYALPRCLWHTDLRGRQAAILRGPNYELTRKAIAYYQSYRHLAHAAPTGRLISDTHLNGFGFRRGDRHVAALWSRNRAATVAVHTAADAVEVCDYMGGAYRIEPLDGRALLGVNERLVYVAAQAPMTVARSADAVAACPAPVQMVAGAGGQMLRIGLTSGARSGDRVTLDVPPRWTASPAAVAVEGTSASAAFTLTVPADAAAGTYPVTVFLTRAGRRFAASSLAVEVTGPYVWRDGRVVCRAPIEADRVELRVDKTGRRVVARLCGFSTGGVAARVSVTSTLTDRMRPETHDLGAVLLGPGRRHEVVWPVTCKPDPIPYALRFRFTPPEGPAWEHRTQVFGLPPVDVVVRNASFEKPRPRRPDLPDGVWVSRGPWQYREDRDDAHTGRAYLRVQPPDKDDARFTRMETHVRVNPGRRCYGRLWVRVTPHSDLPVSLGCGVAVCLYGERGRRTGPSTTIGLPPARKPNTWTPLDFTFVPGPDEREAWIYLDVRRQGPDVDVDDLTIGEAPLPPVR